MFLDHWARLTAGLPRVVVDVGEPTRWRIIWLRPPSLLGMCEDLVAGMERMEHNCTEHTEHRPLN